MGVYLRDLATAFQFLTVLPWFSKPDLGAGATLARSAAFFPVVGGFIGLVSVGAFFLTEKILGPLPAIMAALASPVIITGGLHLDGLADTADGVFSGRNRRVMLDIMRDSRIGSMGVLALALTLLFKFSLLVSLPPEIVFTGLIIAPVVGRIGVVLAAAGSVYARSGSGLGRAFVEGVGKREVLVALAIGLMLVLAADSLRGLFPLAATLLASWISRNWFQTKLGGLTGDTLGAIIEVGEVVGLAACIIASKVI